MCFFCFVFLLPHCILSTWNLKSIWISFCGITHAPVFVVCYNMKPRCLPRITKAEGGRSCFSLLHRAKKQTRVLCLARGFTPGTLNLDARLEKGWKKHTSQQLYPDMFLPNNHSLSSCFRASPAVLVLSSTKLFLQTSCTSVCIDIKPVNFILLKLSISSFASCDNSLPPPHTHTHNWQSWKTEGGQSIRNCDHGIINSQLEVKESHSSTKYRVKIQRHKVTVSQWPSVMICLITLLQSGDTLQKLDS